MRLRFGHGRGHNRVVTSVETYLSIVRAALMDAGFVRLAEQVDDDYDPEYDDDDCVPAIYGAVSADEIDALAKACDLAYAAAYG